jgi:hypothetical protein
MAKRTPLFALALVLFTAPAFAQRIFTAGLFGKNVEFGSDVNGTGTAMIAVKDQTVSFVITASNIGPIYSAYIARAISHEPVVGLTGVSGTNGIYSGTTTVTNPAILEEIAANPSRFVVKIITTDRTVNGIEGSLIGGLPLVAGAPGVDAAPVLPFTCGDAETSVCLKENRFKTEVSFRTFDGDHGSGRTSKLTRDSASFWFFQPDNLEMMVKVVDACTLNNRFWVFASGLTNVEVTLRVTDSLTGKSKVYVNPNGVPFLPIQDINAFKCQ